MKKNRLSETSYSKTSSEMCKIISVQVPVLVALLDINYLQNYG